MKERMPALGSALVLAVLILLPSSAFSLDYFAEGERLFRENKPSEAIAPLYQASLAAGTDPKVFNYLGLCYRMTGKYDDAISIFMKGTSAPGTDRKLLFCNAGNVYFAQNMFVEAEMMYSKSVEIDSAYAPAYLQRANARVRLENFPKAVDDYTVYLMLDPASWQKESIRQLIALLSTTIKQKEETAALAEAQKATAEAEKKAAAERYQKLLDDVSASLQSIDGASTKSAGSENIMDYNEEGQLE